MRLLLDEQPCATNAATVGEAIADAANQAEAAGRTIIQVVVDGESWPQSRLTDPASIEIRADEVRLVSVPPALLVRETFASAAEAVDDADALQQKAAEKLQADDAAAALPMLQEAMTVWGAVREAVVGSIELLDLDLAAIDCGDDGPALQVVEQLAQRLRDLRDGLVGADPAAIADILLYDFPETAVAWRGLLSQLDDAVTAKFPEAA